LLILISLFCLFCSRTFNVDGKHCDKHSVTRNMNMEKVANTFIKLWIL